MKKQILIVFGGKSGEHEVSVKSARAIEANIDREKYETRCLGVTQDGRWHYGDDIQSVTDGAKVLPPNATLSLPDGNQAKGLALTTDKGLQPIASDIIFPIIHGTNGEDGTLQGMLELANVPYVGSGVLGSAVAMDKVTQKTICAQHTIPQTEYVWFTWHEWQKNQDTHLQAIAKLTYPLFVKPANLGSSVGVTKVSTEAELRPAIETAFSFDNKILVEQGVTDLLEVEVGVLGNEDPRASVCGTIKPNTEFYDYDTKYVTDDIEVEIPAKIPDSAAEEIRNLAIKTFKVLNCSGLARVDFFYQTTTGKVFLSELNTLPGFTPISMYPKLWEASGLSYTDLISELLELAEERWSDKQRLSYVRS